MAQHDEKGKGAEPSLNQVVARIARAVLMLDPGSAAALRRGPLVGSGAAAFWKLTAEHAPGPAAKNEVGWGALIQAIAILTPKGTDPGRRPAHDPSVSMGAALHDARLSELRLARLLGAAKEMQRDLAVRLCRRLSGTDHGRFHLGTLARLILFGNEETNRKIAREFYSRAQAISKAERTSDDPNAKEASADA